MQNLFGSRKGYSFLNILDQTNAIYHHSQISTVGPLSVSHPPPLESLIEGSAILTVAGKATLSPGMMPDTVIERTWTSKKRKREIPQIPFLKHDCSMLRQCPYPVCGSWKSQASYPWAKWQRLTSSIMEKPHTGLDECLRVLQACFRKIKSLSDNMSI